MSLEFEWDASKARVNKVSHGIDFEEALTVFRDPLARIFDDEEHSLDEPREVIVGALVETPPHSGLLHRPSNQGSPDQRA